MTISKVISTAIEKGILIVKILGLGSKDVRTTYNVSPFGIDSNIPKGYRGIYADTGNIGEKILIGIISDKAITDIGETRIYSEKEDGTASFDILLKKNGTCEIGGNSDFMVRFSELKSGFDKLKSDLNQVITDLNTHTHLCTAPGTASGTMGKSVPPVELTPTAASIDDCKIAEIKTL